MSRLTHKRLGLYLAWIVVFASTFTAGVYTMGMFVDMESVGTAEDPNSIEVVEEFVDGDSLGGGEFANEGFSNGGNTGNAGNAYLGIIDALDLPWW